METLKIKNKNNTEFIVDFDNTEDMINFIINYTEKESMHDLASIIGVRHDN